MPYHGTISRTCQQCGKEFLIHPCHERRGMGKFCSVACRAASQSLGIVARDCAYCGTPFQPAQRGKRGLAAKYCSVTCRDAANSERLIGERNPNWIGGLVEHTCQRCGKVTMMEQYLVRNGRQYCSHECRDAAVRELGLNSGEKSGSWKGGLTGKNYPARQAAMNTPEYKAWRTAVFIRDNFTCQRCGQRGGKLHAHHVKRWTDFPELRYDIANGMSLCVSCHRAVNHNGPILAYRQVALVE